MTATRTLITVGEGAAASDVQRIADAAAYADDRAHEVIFTPGVSGIQKRIVPLGNDTATQLARFLVVPGTAAGTVQVMPARFIAGVAPYTIAAAISSFTAVQSPAFANNPGGSTRTDLVYATLGMASTTTSRRSKPPTSGSTGSAPLAVEQHPTLTVAIAQGTSGGAAGALPSDATNTYNFPLASVTLPAAYVNTTPIAQTMIAQNYERGWIPLQRVQSLQVMNIFNGSAAYKPTTSRLANSQRFGDVKAFYGEWKVTSTVPGPVVLDSSIDWRSRIIWGQVFLVGATPLEETSPTTTAPITGSNANVLGTTTVWNVINAFFSAAGNISGVNPSNFGANFQTFGSNNNPWILYASATDGSLIVNLNGGTPVVNDHYAIILYCTDRFVF